MLSAIWGQVQQWMHAGMGQAGLTCASTAANLCEPAFVAEKDSEAAHLLLRSSHLGENKLLEKQNANHSQRLANPHPFLQMVQRQLQARWQANMARWQPLCS